MSIYGDYAAQIIQGRRAKELQAESRRDSAARVGKQKNRDGAVKGRGSRSAATGRARAV